MFDNENLVGILRKSENPKSDFVTFAREIQHLKLRF